MDDNSAIYVTDERPAAEARYRVRFYFDPNSASMAQGDNHALFYGYSGSGMTRPVLRILIRFNNGSYQVQSGLLGDGTTWRKSSWLTLSDNMHLLELDWQAATAGANNGSLTFWIDGVQRSKMSNVDNDTRRIERVRLGASAGIDSGTRGTYFFDAFESRRLSYIGPIAGAAAAVAEAVTIDPAELTSYTDSDESEPEEAALMQDLLEQEFEQEQSPEEQSNETLGQDLYLPFASH